jgi:hypothetical protein
MSWLRHDDDMLDHPKWIRALRDGGADALLIWWRLCAWSSRRLTDGVIPADMLGEVARLERSKSKARALRALVESALCARRDDGALVIVDYLERNPSKADVQAERERRAQAQRNRRLPKSVTGHAPTSEPPRDIVPARPNPGPAPSHSTSESDARAPEGRPPEVPGLVVVHPGPIKASRRETAETALLGARGVARYEYTPGWKPTKAVNLARALELGLTEQDLWERWDQVQDKHYSQAFRSDEKQFNRELAWLVADKRKASFQASKQSKREREAFELPGRERAIGR